MINDIVKIPAIQITAYLFYDGNVQ